MSASLGNAGASPRSELEDFFRRATAIQSEATRTFTGVLERAYLNIVQARLPRDRPPAIRVIGDDIVGEQLAVVHTRVQTRDGAAVQLDYDEQAGTAWLIRDVAIDGVHGGVAKIRLAACPHRAQSGGGR